MIKSLLPSLIFDLSKRFNPQHKLPVYSACQGAVNKIGSYNNPKISDLGLKTTVIFFYIDDCRFLPANN